LIEIINRIKKAYGFKSDAEVARFLDLKPNTLAMQKSRGTLDLERIIEKCPELNKNWLLHGIGPLRLHTSNYQTPYNRLEYYDIPFFKKVEFDHKGKPKPAHNPVYTLAVPIYYVDEELNEPPENLFLTRVKNDSMHPTFLKNDIILVNMGVQDPINGSIFLVRINSEIDCKRIQSLPGNRYKLISDNDSYSSYEINPEAEGFDVLGRIEWIGHRLH